MNLRSLVPFRDRPNMARPELYPFGSLQRELDRLFEDFTRGLAPLGQQGAGNLVPNIEVTETDNEIDITVEMPGLERNDVEISLDGNILTIRGEKKIEETQGEGQPASPDKAGKSAKPAQGGQSAQGAQGSQSSQSGQSGQTGQGQQAGHGQNGSRKQYHVAERVYGVFLRMLELPPGLDPNSIQATMANGVLKIKIPKPQRVQPKKIEVKEAA